MRRHHVSPIEMIHATARPSARRFRAFSVWRWSRLLLAMAALATCSGLQEARAEADLTTFALTLQQLGKPCFRPVDFHLFSADITDFFGLLTGPHGLLPEPNHQFHPDLGVGPGMPHNPPYNREIKAGLARLELVDQRRFTPEEFQLPKAILFAFMVLPLDQSDCPRGSSPDFAEGPVIPNVLFTADPAPDSVLASRSTFFRRGEVFDRAFTLDLRRLDRITPPLEVDGHSHIPVFLATASDFGPEGAIEGPYAIHSALVDHAGNGWDMTLRFEIK